MAVFAAASILAAWCLPRLPQDPAYHAFADGRAIWGIPNGLNVLSNIPLALVGVWGLALLHRHTEWWITASERIPCLALFAGVALTGPGSAYYHWAPSNETLVWDRLPMTLGFMGFLAGLVTERVSVRLGLRLVVPLVLAGLGGVLYWYATERAGAGDLRPYLFVQFFPLGALLFILALFPPRYTRGGDYIAAVGFYAAAKIAEVADAAIYRRVGQVVSGHTVKHLLAAAGALWILFMLSRREPVATRAPPPIPSPLEGEG